MDDYVKFGLATAVLCLICPPLLGIVAGIAIFCGVWYVAFKSIGG
jgi:hypothetical protein